MHVFSHWYKWYVSFHLPTDRPFYRNARAHQQRMTESEWNRIREDSFEFQKRYKLKISRFERVQRKRGEKGRKGDDDQKKNQSGRTKLC